MNIARCVLITTLLTGAFCLPCITHAEPTPTRLPLPSLCPAAGMRPSVYLQQRQETIRAPQTAEERQARLQQLTSSDSSTRYAAIVAFAFAGDVDVFKHLLTTRNASDIHTFASNYRNSDNTLCLAPAVEGLIIRHLDNSAIARSLFAFFPKNLYRSRAFFDAIIAQQPNQRALLAFPRFVRALTATNLPGIALQILAHAITFSDAAPSKLASPVLETQNTYVTYFVRRRDASVLDYIETILNTMQRQDAVQLKSQAYAALTNMRSSMYRALAHFPSSRTSQICLKELERLTRKPWRQGMTTLLTLLGSALDTPDTTAAQRSQAVQTIADMLEANSPQSLRQRRPPHPRYAPTDYEMRRDSYKLLVALNTRDAADVLLDDLLRVLTLPEADRPRELISRLLESLHRYPATTDIDIPRLLQAAAKLDARSQLHLVPDILAQHPHPAAYTYLLSLLERVLRTDGDPQGKTIVVDRRSSRRLLDNTYEHVLQLVMQYDATQELSRTRQQIDHLYTRGLLREQRYVAASKRLNDLLGDESAPYMAYREQQRVLREEEARHKRQQYIDDLRAKYNLGKYASPETLQRDIQALSASGDTRQTKRRLILAARSALPAVHAALVRPDTSLETRVHLLDILSAMGDPHSVRLIIQVARAEPRLYRSAFLALSKLPQTAESFDFAARYLTQSQDPEKQSRALVYFALHRDPRAHAWAEQYSAPHIHSDVRAAALYLAASLGDHSAKTAILELLHAAKKRSRRTLLLRALAELSSVAEFKAQAVQLALNQRAQDYQNILLYVAFIQASSADKKVAAAEALLDSRDTYYPRQAVRYLVTQNRMDVLTNYLTGAAVYHMPLDLAMMLSPKAALIVVEARRMGYRFEDTAAGLRLIESDR